MRFFDFNWFGLVFSVALPAGVIIGMAITLIRDKIRARRGEQNEMVTDAK